jgi:hypothetical protein
MRRGLANNEDGEDKMLRLKSNVKKRTCE